VAHPPGHPLALLLCKFCTLLPLGPVAFRAGLASALAGAAAAALTALCAAEVARRVACALAGRDATAAADPWIEGALGAGAGIGFGLSYAAAFQAVRPEVYALHAALVMAAAFALLRFDATSDRRALWAAALALGLALANHHLLALAFTAAAALPILLRRPGGRALALAVAAGALGLALYLYLPLRAARHPEVDWGAPSTLDRFLWTVSARAFQKSIARAEASTDVAFALAAQLGVSAPLALLGAYLLLRLRDTRRLGLLLVTGAALDAAAPALVGFDSANPDAYGYLEPAVALLACLATAAPAAILGMVKNPRVSRGTAIALALAGGAFSAQAWPVVTRARFADTDRYGAALLAAAPPRAALVTSNFQTVFALWYLRGVEGQRPDLDHLHRHFLAWPGYRDEALRRMPALAPHLGARDAVDLPSLARTRPVLLEYDLDLDPALTAHLLPTGLIDAVAADVPDAAARDRAERATAERLASLRLDRDEPQTRRALYWNDFLDLSRSCALGRTAAARAAADRAHLLLAGVTDPDLEALAARCVR
jgi:uncharacterized membrane protein